MRWKYFLDKIGKVHPHMSGKRMWIEIILVTVSTMLISLIISLVISCLTHSFSLISTIKSVVIPMILSPLIGFIYFRNSLALAKSEKQLRALLGVTEMNMKEIHHRIKNNLTMIISLMKIQNLRNPEAFDQDFFNQILSRINSMAILHEELYKGREVTLINIREFAERIINEIIKTMKDHDYHLKTDITGDDIFFDADSATPLGLIINEMVTNSLKYGLIKNQENCIRFYCCNRESDYYICYSDSGPGLPVSPEPGKEGSLGMILIRNLVQQMKGELTMTSGDGLTIHISIPRGALQEKEDNRDRLYRKMLFNRNITALTTRILEEGVKNNTYELILEYAIETIKGVDKGSITRLMSDDRYHFVAARGFSLRKLKNISFSKDENLLKPGEYKARVVSNIEILQRDEGKFSEEKISYLNEHGEVKEIHSSIIVPITYNKNIGAMLNLNSMQPGMQFDDEDLDMASAFASQIGLVLEHFERS